MAANKSLLIVCPDELRQQLVEALLFYTDAAYPPGGAECGQVARVSLTDTANALQGEPDVDTGGVEISRRIRAMLKTAINYYVDSFEAAEGSVCSSQRELLLSAGNGDLIELDVFDRAVEQDGAKLSMRLR
jgi:hypothetical protein